MFKMTNMCHWLTRAKRLTASFKVLFLVRKLWSIYMWKCFAMIVYWPSKARPDWKSIFLYFDCMFFCCSCCGQTRFIIVLKFLNKVYATLKIRLYVQHFKILFSVFKWWSLKQYFIVTRYGHGCSVWKYNTHYKVLNKIMWTRTTGSLTSKMFSEY